jgi:hypothetical protein
MELYRSIQAQCEASKFQLIQSSKGKQRRTESVVVADK